MKNTFLFLLSLASFQSISAQSFYDEGTIQTIEITFVQSNWDALLDAEKAGNEDYIMAQSVSINGTVLDSVGVKYKGNSTYSANQVKNPFHIELDTYKTQDYQGYTDIKLSNVKNDPSFVREVLSYKILRQYMHAPLSNYAIVYVNGTQIGLYSSSEAIGKKFVNNHFYSKSNAFFKCNPPAGAGPGTTDYPNLTYLGTDSTNYYDSYEMKSVGGWQDLIDLTDTLTNNIADITNILDVDRALWMMAFDNVLVNLDSYIGAFAQNYYLYRDDFRRFSPIVWDLNESFGKFSSTGTSSLNSTTAKQQMDHMLHQNDASYPLASKLLNVPMYERMYLAHLKTILLENFDNNSYYTSAQTLQSTIDAAVQNDPNKFYTYANFTSNLTTDITAGGGPGGGTSPGITNLMNGRSSYLLGLSDFTQTEPTISNIQQSTSTVYLNTPFTVTADITNENIVYFGYRSEQGAPFVRTVMFDDGLHNDGAASDGVYGIEVSLNNTFMEYYIYAENSGIGNFSPVRAEHEYYNITVVDPPAGDLVINEFQASNVATVADQDGEFDDWIELYNNTSSTIDLSTYYLSDDATNLTLWQIPAGATIAAGGYFIVWADKDDLQAGAHANFKLSASGETVFLSDANGTVVDQVTFGAQGDDEAYARFPNGIGAFATLLPTYNSQNNQDFIGVETSTVSKMSIYPNPANEVVYFSFGENEENNLEIYDAYGKLVYLNNVSNQLELHVGSWSKGIYFVRLGTLIQKLIVD